MRSQFHSWLKNYKDLSAVQIRHVMAALDGLSDKALINQNIATCLFAGDGYIKFVRKRQGIQQAMVLSSAEKRSMVLLGEYSQMIECTSMPYPVLCSSNLLEYCNSIRMAFSYKPVLLLVLLDLFAWKSPVLLDDVIDRFCLFYRNRYKQGLVAEIDNSIFARDSFSREDAKRIILSNPVAVLVKDNVIICDDEQSKLFISSAFIPSNNELNEIHELLADKLNVYYSNLIPPSVQSSALSAISSAIRMLENAIMLSSEESKVHESEDLILKLKHIWTNDVCQSQEPVNQNNSLSVDMGELCIAEDDPRKIGKLVQAKMKQLSQINYTFDPIVFNELCSLEWSKSQFKNLYYPVFKVVDPSIDFSAQRCDYRGKYRYYEDLYSFGNGTVFLTSQWYKESKDKFIAWFNSLIQEGN